MDEISFPPSPNWFSPNIIAYKYDGTIAYGSRNNIIVLRFKEDSNFKVDMIPFAHENRVTSVSFPVKPCEEILKDAIVSSSDDGHVKLWQISTSSAIIAHDSHWNPGEKGKVLAVDWNHVNPLQVCSLADNDTIVVWNVLSNTTVKFTLKKVSAAVLSCSLHAEKIVAIGTKSGLVLIVDLIGPGQVLYRLRGHDSAVCSLSWCPLPYNIFKTKSLHKELLLASASKDKDIYIWRAGTDGQCETAVQLPVAPMSKRESDQLRMKTGANSTFTALFWSKPGKLYASSMFGELLVWNIKSHLHQISRSFNPKKSIFKGCWKIAHSLHSRGLFAIVGSRSKVKVEMHGNIKEISELKFEIESSDDYELQHNTKGREIVPFWELLEDDTCQTVWTAAQDRTLVELREIDEKFDVIKNLHTLHGSAYCAVGSPHDPNRVAIAVGDGMIRLWNLTEMNGGVHVYWQKINDRVMSLAWHPTRDGFLAYGTSEGRVGLIETNTNKMPMVLKPCHPKPVYWLSWGPPFYKDGDESFKDVDYALFSVCNSIISQFNSTKLNADPINLSSLIDFPCKRQTDVCWTPDFSLLVVGNEDGSICLLKPPSFEIVTTLQAYKKPVQSISWHPISTSFDKGISPYKDYFTSGSTDNDNEIRVFKYFKEEDKHYVEQVASLKGHRGFIQYVSWSPHISGQLVSCSSDCTVQIWDVSTQAPLCNYDFGENNMPFFSIWSPINPKLIITGCRSNLVCVWDTSKATATLPPIRPKAKKSKERKCAMGKLVLDQSSTDIIKGSKTRDQENGKSKSMHDNVAMAESNPTSKNKEKKIFSRAWKGDGNSLLNGLCSLLQEEENAVYGFRFFGDKEHWMEMVEDEEKRCNKSNNWTALYEMSLWRGNLKDLIEEKMKTGHLDDYLLSLTPMVSPRLWQDACIAYSKSLAENRQFCKASTYLMACHKVEEAIDLLLDADYFEEALYIARCRLHEGDPKLKNIVEKYAVHLKKIGCVAKACECYIYLKEYREVIKLLSKRSTPEYLRVAALAAKRDGNKILESKYAVGALLKAFEKNNTNLADEIFQSHSNIGILSIVYNMCTTLHVLTSSQTTLTKDIISHVQSISEVTDLGENYTVVDHLYEKIPMYRDKHEMLVSIARSLSMACCVKNKDLALTYIIRALNAAAGFLSTEEKKPHYLYNLCKWLAPNDFLAEDSIFHLNDDTLSCKIKTLRAYLCEALVDCMTDNTCDLEIGKAIGIIRQLKSNLLDAENFRYFKNRLEIKTFEKLLTEGNKNLTKTTSQVNGIEDHKDTNSESAESIDKTVEDSVEEIENESGKTEERDVDVNSGYVESLRKLKDEVEAFEKSRITVPNPVSSFFKLRNMCQVFSENNEQIQHLLKEVEQDWAKLDSGN